MTEMLIYCFNYCIISHIIFKMSVSFIQLCFDKLCFDIVAMYPVFLLSSALFISLSSFLFFHCKALCNLVFLQGAI